MGEYRETKPEDLEPLDTAEKWEELSPLFAAEGDDVKLREAPSGEVALPPATVSEPPSSDWRAARSSTEEHPVFTRQAVGSSPTGPTPDWRSALLTPFPPGFLRQQVERVIERHRNDPEQARRQVELIRRRLRT